jgi:outer membrane protein OmpA-like peptidoglycan-associated protein
MSKSMEQASCAVNTSGRVTPAGPVSKKDQGPADDLSMKHVGIAIGVFVVMLVLFGYGFRVQQSRVTAKESEMKIAEVTTTPKSDISAMVSEASAQASVPKEITAVTVKEERVASPTRIQSLHADIYFDFGKTRLRADAIETLQLQAQLLKQDGHWAVLIQGYTDRHGSVEYNKALALRRGESVKQFLTELGIPADSMKVISLGQDAVMCDDHTPTCAHLNRRVHLELVKLEPPSVSVSPVMPLSTVSAKQEAETDPIMTNVGSMSDQNHDTDLLTSDSQPEVAPDTIVRPEAH